MSGRSLSLPCGGSAVPWALLALVALIALLLAVTTLARQRGRIRTALRPDSARPTGLLGLARAGWNSWATVSIPHGRPAAGAVVRSGLASNLSQPTALHGGRGGAGAPMG